MYRRLSTLAGEEAQVDWGAFGSIRIGRGVRSLSGFVMVLSYYCRRVSAALIGTKTRHHQDGEQRRCVGNLLSIESDSRLECGRTINSRFSSGSGRFREGNMATTRREFVKQAGAAAAGAVALSRADIGSVASFLLEAQQPEFAPRTPFPSLNPRARGWLHFLWEKTTTPDDWSSTGTPHPWWDRYSVPGVQSYPRFDLQFSSYALLLMADQTPAWREVYTRILDGLASRFPTYGEPSIG